MSANSGKKPFEYCHNSKQLSIWILAVIGLLLLPLKATAYDNGDRGNVSPAVSASMVREYIHLIQAMDKYHKTFDVYTDLSAAGNHFVTLGKMWGECLTEDCVTINPGCADAPYRGDTCIENSFNWANGIWGGYYLLNGVLGDTDTQPSPNWGDYPDAGIDLTGATELTFYVKGLNGGERVEFFALGVGRDADTGVAIAPYPGSSIKISTDIMTLTQEWQRVSISLAGRDLSYVLGGFGWTASALQNGTQDVTFYLDDIQYDLGRMSEPRFLVSYETVPSELEVDKVMKNVGFVYDNSLALIAFLATGHPALIARARLIADSLVYAVQNDRSFDDGRLRDAYQAGDLVLPSGWTPNGREDTVRMAGWWDVGADTWYEFGRDSSAGNLAWAMLALISYYEKMGGTKYLMAAEGIGDWIDSNCRDSNVDIGGYTGGYLNVDVAKNYSATQVKAGWKSTEHNIDIFAAFARLYFATRDTKWRDRAIYAGRFVINMWNSDGGHFWTGTLDDGITISEDVVPVDVNAWAVMIFRGSGDYYRGVDWVENNCHVLADGFEGFSFSDFDLNHVWFEGTAQMVVAYQILGDTVNAEKYLAQIREAQMTATNGNALGIVAASGDGLETGFGWSYFARLHIGATAWSIFAELGYNPYWGIRTR